MPTIRRYPHAGKPLGGATEPQPGQFNFNGADPVVDFAEANGMAVRGHTLVWHSQLADWVRELTTRDEVLAAMERHITTLVSRYRGRVEACVADQDSWRNSDCNGGGSEPLLFGNDYNPKPLAFGAVFDALMRAGGQ